MRFSVNVYVRQSSSITFGIEGKYEGPNYSHKLVHSFLFPSFLLGNSRIRMRLVLYVGMVRGVGCSNRLLVETVFFFLHAFARNDDFGANTFALQIET